MKKVRINMFICMIPYFDIVTFCFASVPFRNKVCIHNCRRGLQEPYSVSVEKRKRQKRIERYLVGGRESQTT